MTSLSPFQIRFQKASFREKLEASRQFGRKLEDLINAYGNAENNLINYGHQEIYRKQYQMEKDHIRDLIEEMRVDNPAVVNSYGIKF